MIPLSHSQDGLQNVFCRLMTFLVQPASALMLAFPGYSLRAALGSLIIGGRCTDAISGYWWQAPFICPSAFLTTTNGPPLIQCCLKLFGHPHSFSTFHIHYVNSWREFHYSFSFMAHSTYKRSSASNVHKTNRLCCYCLCRARGCGLF